MTNAHTDPKNVYKAASLTVLVLVTTALILYFVRILTPNPPFPELPSGGGGGVEISLGNSNVGMGDDKVDDISTKSQTKIDKNIAPTKIVNTEPSPVSSKTIASDNIDAVNIKKTEKEIKKIESEPQVNTKGLMKKNTSKGNDATPGKKGDSDGDPNSKSFTKGHGQGNGNGSGFGDGNGPGKGPGPGGPGVSPRGMNISKDLLARGFKNLPTPRKSVKSGTVVVQLSIDESGKVISGSVRAGVSGSNTSDPELIKLATDAARMATFNVGKNITKGTITYIFENK